MIERLTRAATFALYQSSLALGIAMLPIALLTSKLGITLPIRGLVERTESAYRAAR